MEPVSFVPFFLIFINISALIVRQRKRRRRIATLHNMMRKGVFKMAIEAFKRNIGRKCQITTMIERRVKGSIIGVEGNWIEIETKGKTEYINADFIERFRILSE